MIYRLLYTLFLWLLLPYIFFHLFWRARKQPQYLRHIGERFGFYPHRPRKPIIWLHTVSVGETRAAATLIKRLQAQYPDQQILLSHTTPTGRETSEQLYGDSVLRVYLPYDYPFAVKRFLRHFQPRIGVLLETEIWFNLIHQCKRHAIPLLLLNARLSQKSARGYGRFARLTRIGLGELSHISAQTPEDAERLKQLGARSVSVMGNLKYDIVPPPSQLMLGEQLRQLFGASRPVLLAASTREGEEAMLLSALKSVNIPGLLTIIVPRHPQRFDEVAVQIKERGYTLQRRSENLPVAAATQVVLGDSMGEMFAYYAACDVALIGGSLQPLGGQNLIEACAVGKPVLFGPHMFNFAQASESALQHGAALRLADISELPDKLEQLLNHHETATRMGTAAKAFVEKNQGATERAINLLSAII